MKTRMAALGAAAMTLAAMAAPAFAATELVSNGGFETGDFTGWSAGYAPGGANVCCMGFQSTGGSKVQTSGSNLGSALGGTWSAYGDWDGGDADSPVDLNQDTDFWIRQAIAKATDVTSATLSFQFKVAGGAYASYGSNPAYGPIEKRDVTANFLGSDLSLKSNLYTYERDLMTGAETFATSVLTVTLDVTGAYNALDDGTFYLDFGRNIPQYFTGAGYFVMDDVSLKVGDAVLPPDPTSGTPEPGAWALMILGFGGAGAALRQKRRAALA